MLFLLDIQMQDGTGFDLLNHFENPLFHTIFTTAYDHFAIKAFKYCAVDYLLKPIDPDDLQIAVNKVERLLDAKNNDYRNLSLLIESFQKNRLEQIAISTAEGLILVKIDDIFRLESSGNYTTFHLKENEKVTVAKPLKEYEGILNNEFIRTHQSHLINLAYVKMLARNDGGGIIMSNGDRVPIARRKRDAIIELLQGRSVN